MFNRLREERTRLGFTQEQFAALGGVKMRSQINYEQGKNCPDGTYYAGIAAIGADVQYILTGVHSANALAPDEQLLLERYRNSPQVIKTAALQVVLTGQQGGGTVIHGNVGQENKGTFRNVNFNVDMSKMK